MRSSLTVATLTDYLGTSSNESFGRRLLSNAHERVYDTPLPAASLIFEGQTYELARDGRQTSNKANDTALPTADFALFLVNAVKFHCGQLFHLFDEQEFMRNFSNYHDYDHNLGPQSDLWHVHYLLILAIGKALIVRVGQARRPPGAELYLQAMNLLPDIPHLCRDPVLSMEILCCAALYLQCLDMRTSALLYVSSTLSVRSRWLRDVADWAGGADGRSPWYTYRYSKPASLRGRDREMSRNLVDHLCVRLSPIVANGNSSRSPRARYQCTAALFRRGVSQIPCIVHSCQTRQNDNHDTTK